MEWFYQGQLLYGKWLFVFSYGGVGDQFQYVCYLYVFDVFGCVGVIVVVFDVLMGLLCQMFLCIEFVGVYGVWVDMLYFVYDYWCLFLVFVVQFGYVLVLEGVLVFYLMCLFVYVVMWCECVLYDGYVFGMCCIGLNWCGCDESDVCFYCVVSLCDFVLFV